MELECNLNQLWASFHKLDGKWDPSLCVSRYSPTWPRGYQQVKAPRFLDTRLMKVARSSPLRTGRLYPRNILVLIFRSWVNAGHMDLSDASEKFPSARPGIDPWAFRLVAQRPNHYGTPGTMRLKLAMEKVERSNSSSIRKGNLYRIVKVGEWVGNVQTLSQIYEGLLMIMTADVLYSVYCLCNGRSGLQACIGPREFSVFQNIHSSSGPT